MKQESRKRALVFFFALTFSFLFFPRQVHADLGPKPSATIDFRNVPENSFYVALLSYQDASPGLHRTGQAKADPTLAPVYEKFSQYSLPADTYFTGKIMVCGEDKPYTWGAFPPTQFYTLCYFPQADRFIISSSLQTCQALHSSFTCDMQGLDLETADTVPVHYRHLSPGNIFWMLPGFLFRLFFTLAVEILVALLFGFRSAGQIKTIVFANCLTLASLDIFLNLTGLSPFYYRLPWVYLLCEIIIFVIEGLFYKRKFPSLDQEPGRKSYPLTYAFTANVLSFLGGFLLIHILPQHLFG